MEPLYYICPIELAQETVKEGKSVKRCKGQLLPLNRRVAHKNGPGGMLDFNPSLLDQLVANFSAGIVGKTLPVTDNSFHQHPADYSPAWITGVRRVGDGIDVEIDLANPQLAERVSNGEVRMLSAEIDFAYKDPATGKTGPVITGAAFTSRPYLKNMRPVEVINFSEMQEWSQKLPDGNKDEQVVQLSEQVVELSTALEAEKTAKAELESKVTKLSETVNVMHQSNLELAQNAAAEKDERLLEKFSSKVPPALLARLSSLLAMDRGEAIALSEIVKKEATTQVSLSDMTRAATSRDLAILLCEEIAALPIAATFSEDQVKLAERRGASADDNAKAIIAKSRELQAKGVNPEQAYLQASKEIGG